MAFAPLFESGRKRAFYATYRKVTYFYVAFTSLLDKSRILASLLRHSLESGRKRAFYAGANTAAFFDVTFMPLSEK